MKIKLFSEKKSIIRLTCLAVLFLIESSQGSYSSDKISKIHQLYNLCKGFYAYKNIQFESFPITYERVIEEELKEISNINVRVKESRSKKSDTTDDQYLERLKILYLTKIKPNLSRKQKIVTSKLESVFES